MTAGAGPAGRWVPTAAHLRAVAAAVAVIVIAVATGRPSAIVVVTPLVVIAAWSVATRPTVPVRATSRLTPPVLHEGQAATWTATVTGGEGMDRLATAVASSQRWETFPTAGTRATAVPADHSTATSDTIVRSLRWGHHDVGEGFVVVESSWGAFRAGPIDLAPHPLTTLPVPSVFDARAPVPEPTGIVGAHRARRTGDGAEFASIRPFTVGDRIRRVHWPVSLRTGTLHATVSNLDLDAHVMVLVDATADIGPSDGIDGRASSLDRSVRAAAAIAEHFLQRGDRVGLRSVGGRRAVDVRAMAGRHHLRRVLGALSSIETGGRLHDRWTTRPLRVPPGGLVVVLSPLLIPGTVDFLHALSRRRLNVVAVDVLPEDSIDPTWTAAARLAWRIRLLERAATIDGLERDGVAVTTWHGPGSLDQVLRRLGRRSSAARGVSS